MYIFSDFMKHPVAMSYGLGYYLSMLRKALEYAGVETAEKPDEADIIHLHDVKSRKSFESFLGYGKKIILHYHTSRPPCRMHYYASRAHLVVFVSRKQKELYGCEGIVLHNAVLPRPKAKADVQTRLYDFIFTSRHDPYKGLDWIEKQIRSASHKYRFAVTGSVSFEGALNFGYVDDSRLDRLLATSKIHLLPSYIEPFGLATLRAMLQGTAPAISVHAGVAELVPDELSVKFDPYRHDIEYIVSEYRRRRLWEKESEIRSFALKHDHKWYAKQLMEVYNEVLR